MEAMAGGALAPKPTVEKGAEGGAGALATPLSWWGAGEVLDEAGGEDTEVESRERPSRGPRGGRGASTEGAVAVPAGTITPERVMEPGGG